ncbi:MAG TPA: DUF4126 domain-containing protein [Prolixibacteraceae bacterium]|nr:DUF4126 domain-containing protein [Prolixibacteraceae bacterium]
MEYQWIVAVALGIGLSASTGFRVFIPLLIAGVAARMGVLPLNESFLWISSNMALITFGVAALFEVAAYYIPFVDNLLDTIAMPLAIGGGTLLAASVLPIDEGFMRWITALIVGGGASAVVQGGTSALRLISSGTTAGIGNPIVSTGENAAAIGFPLMVILMPVVMTLILIFVVFLIFRALFKRKRSQQKIRN